MMREKCEKKNGTLVTIKANEAVAGFLGYPDAILLRSYCPIKQVTPIFFL